MLHIYIHPSSFTIINTTVHIKSANNVHTGVAIINVTIHIKSAINVHTVVANIIVKVHIKYVSVDFSSCFSNVISDFLMNKINFCWRRQAFASFQTWLPQV